MKEKNDLMENPDRKSLANLHKLQAVMRAKTFRSEAKFKVSMSPDRRKLKFENLNQLKSQLISRARPTNGSTNSVAKIKLNLN